MSNQHPGPEYRTPPSPFGEPRPGGKKHYGMDYPAPEGTEIRAASRGRVVFSEKNPGGYGNTIIIEHIGSDGKIFYTLYAHMKKDTNIPYGTTTE